MSKKLLTNDAELASKVENAMREQKIPCARIQLYKKEHGDAVPDKDKILLAVTNHNGEAMRNVIDSYKKKRWQILLFWCSSSSSGVYCSMRYYERISRNKTMRLTENEKNAITCVLIMVVCAAVVFCAAIVSSCNSY